MARTLKNGRYRLTADLGIGALGEVHAATDRIDGQTVVLKWPRRVTGAEDVEHAMLMALDHPSVVTLLGAFEEPSIGSRVLVEPFLDGDHLDVAELTLEEFEHVAVRLAEAVSYLHRRGIRHGDIKPDNIMVERTSEGPNPVLLDFGLATPADEPGLPGGTPAFLAPEIGRGERPSAALDWWALGTALDRARAAREDGGRTNDVLAPLIGALLTEDPRARTRNVCDVMDVLALRSPPQLPRHLPAFAPDDVLGAAQRRVMESRLGRGSEVIPVSGDDESGRAAFLRALRVSLLGRGVDVIVRDCEFSLDALAREIATTRGRHLDAPRNRAGGDRSDRPEDDQPSAVVLLDDRGAASRSGRALCSSVELSDPTDRGRVPLIVVAARETSAAGAAAGVHLPPVAAGDVERALTAVLAVDRDGETREAGLRVAEAGGHSTRGVESVIRRSIESGHIALRNGALAMDRDGVARIGAARIEEPLDEDTRAVLDALHGNGGALDRDAVAEVTGHGFQRVTRAVARAAAAGAVRHGSERDCPVVLADEDSGRPPVAMKTWSLLRDEEALARRLETWLASPFPEAAARPVRHLRRTTGAPTPALLNVAVRGLLRANRGEEALALLEDAPASDEVALLMARCDMTLGRPESAQERLSRRLPLASPRNLPLMEARMAHAWLESGRSDEAVARWDRLIDSEHVEAAVEALTLSAVVLSSTDPDEARRRFRRAAERVAPEDHGRAGACLSNHGAFERRAGRTREAVRLLELAVERLEAHGDAGQSASALTNLGAALAQSGRFADAVTAHRRALLAYESAGNREAATTVRASIGITRFRAGFLTAARRDLRRCEAQLEGRGEVAERVRQELIDLDALLGRAGAVRRRGDPAEARIAGTLARYRGESSRGDPCRDLRSRHVEERLLARAAAVAVTPGIDTRRRRRLASLRDFISRLETGMSERQKVAFRAATVIPIYEDLVERLEQAVSPAVDQAPLLRVLRGVTDAADRDAALRAVVDGTLAATQAVRAFIVRQRGGRTEVLLSDHDSAQRGDMPVSTHAVERSLFTGRATFITDAASDADLGFAPSVQMHGLRSVACIPLQPARSDTVLYLDSPLEEGAFDSDESRGVAEALGRAAAFALALFERADSERDRHEESSRELASKSAELSHLRAQMGEGSIPGRSPAILALNGLVDRIAPSDLPVLIRGETGSGKELAARALHARSARRGAPFIALNCAALPATLAESELFGHVRGAFSGAVSDEPGLMRLADGGTLFLDEIGDMPTDLQPKLLRAIESGVVRPVGGDASFEVDVRVVSATLQDARTTLREDLYFRLAGVTLDVPALRERRDDIAYLVARFLRDAGCDKPVEHAALAALEDYDWPGNVRQLRNVVDRVAVLAVEDEIRLTDLPDEIVGYLGQEPRSLEEVERDAVADALRFTAGDKKHAATLLGISRTTLYNKMKRFGM